MRFRREERRKRRKENEGEGEMKEEEIRKMLFRKDLYCCPFKYK